MEISRITKILDAMVNNFNESCQSMICVLHRSLQLCVNLIEIVSKAPPLWQNVYVVQLLECINISRTEVQFYEDYSQ